MDRECVGKQVFAVQQIVLELREQLTECRLQVSQLRLLQDDFRSKVSQLLSKGMETSLEGKPVVGLPAAAAAGHADAETQTQEPVCRRWNSDLSLDLDMKMNPGRFNVDDSMFCVSSETIAAPIIRVGSQRKGALKPKYTNRLEVVSYQSKRPSENLLLSDLGLTSQAPEFSQSEFNLSSEEHWLKENQKCAGRVRFLSQDDRHCLKGQIQEDGEMCDFVGVNDKLGQSGSWATLTHSERDLSEMDSTFSLNYPEVSVVNKQLTSTPYKGLRSKLKQSVSCNDLLPSKATQSMPNLQKPAMENSRNETLAKLASCRQLIISNTDDSAALSSSNVKRTPTSTRRSSLTCDVENGPYVPTTISSLYLGGRVKALHGGHLVVTGIVWYRGKLPGVNDDVVGIEIDQVGLGGDGTFQGHRYFRCAPGRGLFVPFRKLIMAWPPYLP